MRSLAASTILLTFSLHASGAPPQETTPPAAIRSSAPAASGSRWGYAILSDDTRHDGLVGTTRDKPIRIYDRAKSAFRDIAFDKIESIEQAPDRAWLEQEWRWREGGSDEKIFTGRFYRAAEFRTILHLKTGEQITGDAVAPILVKAGDTLFRLELHKRFKSDQPAPKDELKPLLYIRKLVLTDQPPQPKKDQETTGPASSSSQMNKDK